MQGRAERSMIDAAALSDRTVASPTRRAWMVRALVVAIILALLIAATSFFTGLEAEATASGGGIQATVNYAVVARRGEVVPLRISVSGLGSSDVPVTVWIRDSYLDDLELNGWTPAPSSTEAGPDRVGVTFDDVAQDLSISLHGRLLPGADLGTHELAVVIETEVGELDFLLRTLVVP
ncbi:MAG TPA: hypothetical protein VJR05_04675 [Acidimicrobiia bacterium]|nr:hypothetical protein [Acidimicrobiia bacterium]